MNMLLTIAGMFAGPIGALINKGIAFGAASFVTWSVAHGLPLDSASNIAALAAGAISTAISGLAATQGVHIDAINSPDNGLKVVKASVDAPMVKSPLK